MMFEFATKDGKKPDNDVVPTRLSVAGQEYEVRDYCVEGPARYQADFEAHGFRPRQRPKVAVQTPVSPVSPVSPSSAAAEPDARPGAKR